VQYPPGYVVLVMGSLSTQLPLPQSPSAAHAEPTTPSARPSALGLGWQAAAAPPSVTGGSRINGVHRYPSRQSLAFVQTAEQCPGKPGAPEQTLPAAQSDCRVHITVQ